MGRPLEGIKVVELATFVAAPSCARLLSDLGAEVIKVERPNGDDWRRTGISYVPARFSDQENPVFDIYNTGKKLIALDLKNPEGLEAFHKLLAQADVFVTNVRPAGLKRLGLSYEDLKEKYPRLIYSIVVGYGEKGPDANKPAFDHTSFWAKSGFLRDLSPLNNPETYSPVNAPGGVGDTVSGMFLMGEICAALINREKTGKGDYVVSSLYHNGIFVTGTMNIICQRPFGVNYPHSRVDHGNPGGNYRCADDEYVILCGISDAKTLPGLYAMLGIPELLTDPRFDTADKRWENRKEYYEILAAEFRKKTADEWETIAQEYDLPIMRMNHFADVAEDEQAWANDYLEYVEFANGRVDVMPRSPIEMGSVQGLKTVPVPLIGGNGREVLKDLGYTDEKIEEMLASGVVTIQQY